MARDRRRMMLDPDGNPDYPAGAGQERIDERLPLSPDGMPDYPGQGAPEAQERIDDRLPPRTPFAASGEAPAVNGPAGAPREWQPDAKTGPGPRYILDAALPVNIPPITVEGSRPLIDATIMRRGQPGSGTYGEDGDLTPAEFVRYEPMTVRQAAEAGLFGDTTPKGVTMDAAGKVRAGFMRPFAERGQEARPGVTTGRQVDEILQRLERAREMDNKQMDVQAGEQFRRGLNETRDLRWGASGPTSAVNRAIAERRGRGEQTDEAIRLAKEAPPPQAGAAKPLTPSQAGALMMRRASLLQGDGVTPLRQEALEEARKIDELLSEGGYGGVAAGKGKPGEGGAAGYKQGDVRMIAGKRHVRDAKGNWKPE